MSDRYDRLVAALDSEWRPTVELKERAEKRVVFIGHGAKVAEWRRVS